MTYVRWTGANGTTFAQDNNYAGGTQTANDDELTIQGTVSIAGATTTRTLDSLTVHRDYSGDVGSSGNHLIFVDIEQVRLQSVLGRMYLTGSTTRANVYIHIPTGRSDSVTLGGVLPLIYIVNTNCGITINSSADVGDIIISNSPGLRLTINTSVTIDNISSDAGFIFTNSAITTGSPSRVGLYGTARMETALGVDCDMETVEIWGPRAFLDDRGSGDISNLRVIEGGYSLRRGNGSAKSITGVKGPRGVIDLGGVGQSVTASIVDIACKDFDLGRTVTYSGN